MWLISLHIVPAVLGHIEKVEECHILIMGKSECKGSTALCVSTVVLVDINTFLIYFSTWMWTPTVNNIRFIVLFNHLHENPVCAIHERKIWTESRVPNINNWMSMMNVNNKWLTQKASELITYLLCIFQTRAKLQSSTVLWSWFCDWWCFGEGSDTLLINQIYVSDYNCKILGNTLGKQLYSFDSLAYFQVNVTYHLWGRPWLRI